MTAQALRFHIIFSHAVLIKRPLLAETTTSGSAKLLAFGYLISPYALWGIATDSTK
jgi:hypothetical protein